MTVSAQTPITASTANGVTTAFPYQFLIVTAADMVVMVDGVTKTLNVDYTLTGVGDNAGGSVLFGAVLAVGAKVLAARAVALQRLTDYQYAGDFKSSTVNLDFDRLWLAMQDMAYRNTIALTFPTGDSTSGVLPTATERANNLLSFDALGKPIVVVPAAGSAASVLVTLAAPGGAALIGSVQAMAGSIQRTLQQRSTDSVNAREFGVIGNGVANDTAALALVKAAAMAGTLIHFTKGTYLTSLPLNFTSAVNITADPGTRIKLTAAAAYVAQIDLTQGGAFWGYGASIDDIIFDGGGFCADGLVLKGVVSSSFRNIRTTNVTGAGLRLAWAQCCNFENYSCSRNIEAFTTTPANGVLVDGQTSSANIFTNIAVEHVSGSGIKAHSLINTVFMNGTSEGNAVGIEFGEAVEAGRTCVGNIVVGMDLEVNAVSDIILRLTANANNFYGLQAGFASPAVQLLGSSNNLFSGGATGGFDMNAASHDNRIDSVKLIGATAGIVNTGARNTWRGVYNLTTAANIVDSGFRGKQDFSIPAAGTATIDLSKVNYASVTATGATLTIASGPTYLDGNDLDITVYNLSGAATAVTWGGAFKITGWVNPANGMYRSVRVRADNARAGYFFVISMSTTDMAI